MAVLRKGKSAEQKERIQLLSDGPPLADVTEWITTGFPAVDSVLGGGLAIGRISEVFGPEGHGKSAFTHRCSKGCQDHGGTVIFLDFEAALDSKKVKQVGIDPTRLVYTVPSVAEEGCDTIKAIVKQLQENRPDGPVLIVWDSVAAAPTDEEKVKASGEKIMPHKAKLMGKISRDMLLELQKARAHILFVNQERDAIGGGPFQEPVVPGGKGIKYAASQRIRVHKVKTLKRTVKKRIIQSAYVVKITTKKSRLTPPHQKVELILDFLHGLSPEMTMLHHFLEGNVAKKVKGMVTVPWHDEPIREPDWYKVMQNDAEFRAEADAVYAPIAKAANWVHGIDDDTTDYSDDDE